MRYTPEARSEISTVSIVSVILKLRTTCPVMFLITISLFGRYEEVIVIVLYAGDGNIVKSAFVASSSASVEQDFISPLFVSIETFPQI